MIGQKGIPARLGGVEAHVAALATRLVHAGHNVTAYARSWYGDKQMKRYNGVDLKFVPTLHVKYVDTLVHSFLATLHTCFMVRPDVIHYHGASASLFALMARVLRPQVVVIATLHDVNLHMDRGFIARHMLGFAEKFGVKASQATIAVSKALRNYASLNYETQVHYIPNGIEPVRMPVNSTILRGFGLQPFQYVLFSAQLTPHKGAHNLIKAWKKAYVEKPEFFAGKKLVIEGASVASATYTKQLRSQASGDDSIVLLGSQAGDTRKALFAGSSFIAHPSVSEKLPTALLEAMSYGKAVIAADIEENMEVLTPCGLPFLANDINDLKKKLVVLMKDPMQAASLGHGARAFVEQNYHWDDIAKETAMVYQEHVALRDGVLVI